MISLAVMSRDQSLVYNSYRIICIHFIRICRTKALLFDLKFYFED